MKKRLRRSDEITRLQRTFLLEKLVGLNDKDAALAAGYSLSVAENTKQKIWAKPGVREQFERLKEQVRNAFSILPTRPPQPVEAKELIYPERPHAVADELRTPEV